MEQQLSFWPVWSVHRVSFSRLLKVLGGFA